MAANSDLEVTVRGRDELSPELAKIESRIIRTVGAISAALAALKIGIAPITAAADLQRELANVTKTTGFTKREIDELRNSLLAMSLTVDVTATDLAKIAAAAGQQGLGRFGVAGVKQFTESVSRMASVLDITAEEAATNVGKIVNLFKVPLRDIEKVVSTFNQVSNNSTAEGKELLDVVKRIGDAAGTLNFEQVTALAATGLDFGLSPEVTGSAVTQIFTSMLAEADKFAELMNTSTDKWIAHVRKNGLEAYLDVLAKLRTVTDKDQIKTIEKLIAGGRQGAFVNKMVQDASNAVVKRNFDSALEGKDGTSAIREQQTVLETFNAQLQITKQSLTVLGAQAGDRVLGQLTDELKDLSVALQSPGMRDFVDATVQGMADIIKVVSSGIRAIADLNVNWTNFIRVGEAFLALKLANALGAMAGNIPVIGSLFRTVAVDSATAASNVERVGKAAKASAAAQLTAQAAVDTQAQSGFARRVANYTELGRLVTSFTDKVKAQAAAQAELIRLEAAAGKAKQHSLSLQDIASNTRTQARTADGAVTSAKDSFRAAEAAQANAVAALVTKRNTKLQALEQAHGARMAAIQADYQTKYAAIQATGTQTGLKALRAARAAAIAEEEAAHAKAVGSTQRYYSGRLRSVEVAGRAEVNLQKSFLMQSLANYDAYYAKMSQAQARATAARLSADKAAGAASNAQTATGPLFSGAAAATMAALMGGVGKLAELPVISSLIGGFSKAAGVATTVATGFGTALRFLGTVIGFVGRIAAGAFFWITIIYSIADAVGLVDKLGFSFQKLTDWLGLTSKASRDHALAMKAEKEAAEELKQKNQELIDKYQQLRDARTGTISQEQIGADLQVLRQSESTDNTLGVVAKFANTLSGIRGTLKQVGEGGKELIQKSIDEQLKKLEQEKAKVLQLQANILNAEKSALKSTAVGNSDATLKAFKDALNDAKKAAAATQKEIDRLRNGSSALGVEAQQAAVSLQNQLGGIRQLFTTESAAAFQQFIVPIAAAQAELERMEKAAEKAGQKVGDSGPYLAQKAIVEQLTEKLRVYVNNQATMPGVNPKTLESMQFLLLLLSLSSDQALSLGAGIAEINKQKLGFTGELAVVPTPPKTTGNTPFTPSGSGNDKKNEARRLAKAQLQLAQADAQAIAALELEKNKQSLDRATDLYERGLTATKEYYAKKFAIENDSLSEEIKGKTREIAAIELTIKQAEKKSDKVAGEADKRRIQGEIAVLKERRKGLRAETDEAERQAVEAFSDQVRGEKNRLIDSLLLPTDLKSAYEANLEELLAANRKFLAQLRSEGRNAEADQFELGYQFDSFKDALDIASKSIDIALNRVSLYRERLAMAFEDGKITAQEQEAAETAAIERVLPLLRKKQQELEAELQLIAKAGKTDAYQEQINRIEEVRQSIEKLGLEANATARRINEGIAGSFAELLDKLTDNSGNALEKMKDFGDAIAKNIKKEFLDSVTQQLTGFFSLRGDGGLGRIVQDALLGPGAKNGTSEAALAGQAAAGGPLSLTGLGKMDGSYTNPFWVQLKDAFGLGGDVPNGSPQDPLTVQLPGGGSKGGTVAKEGEVVAGDGGLMDTVGGFFGSLKTTLGSVFGFLQNGFLSMMDGFGGFFSKVASFFTKGGGSQLFGLIASFFHTGGVVGGPSRKASINPAVFQNAVRYHTGGVAGLKPNEVPAILQKGEEVLTSQDARHRDNLGGQQGTQPAVTLQLHPDAMTYTMRDWFESELSRINATGG